MHILGMPEGEERQKETEEISATLMTKNFPKLMSGTKPQIQKAQKIPSRISAKKLYLGISFSSYRNQT